MRNIYVNNDGKIVGFDLKPKKQETTLVEADISNFKKPIYNFELEIFEETITQQEIDAINSATYAIYKEFPKLRDKEIEFIELHNLKGIERQIPLSNKGIVHEKFYKKNDKLIWSIETVYWDDDNSDFTQGIKKVIKLYSLSETVLETWDKKIKLNEERKETIKREQRRKIFDYLKSQQPTIYNLLYNNFNSNIEDYINTGIKADFEAVLTDAKDNHSDAVVKGTLSTEVPTLSGGTTTVLQGILYELQ